MATSTSLATIAGMRDKLSNAITRANAQAIRAKAAVKSDSVMESAVTVGGGALSGIARAKFPDGAFGLPADLLSGLAAHGVGLAIGGKHKPLYHAAGSGALASWAGRMAYEYALASPAATVGGRRTTVAGARKLTAQEIRDYYNTK